MKYLKSKLMDLYWGIYGRSAKNPPLPESPISFLFVCKGNRCRSPFAEFLSRLLAKSKGITKGVFFHSAGIMVSMPSHSPDNAVDTAKKFGIDLTPHISKRIVYEMMKYCDMIIAMEGRDFTFLRKKYPEFRNKIFLLTLFERDSREIKHGYSFYNILDPYDGLMDNYYTCYKRIEKALDGLLSKIFCAKKTAGG